MLKQSSSVANRKTGFAPAILFAGCVAGSLDAVAAVVQYYLSEGKDATKVFQFIASGIFGKEAFTGGPGFALAGLLFHFMIACLFALVFFLLFPAITRVIKNKVVAGLVYGLLIWLIMNFIVVPSSNAPALPISTVKAVAGAIIVMVCVGLPISFIAHKFYLGKDRLQ